jgi:hypothetical protein
MPFFENPEDMIRQLQAESERRAMTSDLASHDLLNFLRDLPPEHKSLLAGLLGATADDPGFGKMMHGILLGYLESQHGFCIACGRNHDEALADITNESTPKKRTHEEVKHDLLHGEWVKVGETKMLPESQADAMRKCGLDDLRQEDNYTLIGFTCLNCGMFYQSVEDRMLKSSSKEGCSGCVQKEKWG